MLRRLNPIVATALCGLIVAGVSASRAQAQGGFDPKPLTVFRASEPRGMKVQVGDAKTAQQCARVFSNTLFVLYDNFSLEVRTPDARTVTVFFRNVTFQPLPEPGVIMRARMHGKIENGPFAGASVRVTADNRDTGTTYADLQVVQGVELRDDVPPWWPSEEGQQGATLDVSFWLLLQRVWARDG